MKVFITLDGKLLQERSLVSMEFGIKRIDDISEAEMLRAGKDQVESWTGFEWTPDDWNCNTDSALESRGKKLLIVYGMFTGKKWKQKSTDDWTRGEGDSFRVGFSKGKCGFCKKRKPTQTVIVGKNKHEVNSCDTCAKRV
jgi:hypothetical protein